MADTAFGVTIGFDTGFFAEILSVDGPSMKREAIDTSHAGTSDGLMTFIPSDLVDMGELKVEIAFIPGTAPPIDSGSETITITWPDGTTWVASGFMTGFEITSPIDDRMTATATLKYTGDIVVTPPAPP